MIETNLVGGAAVLQSGGKKPGIEALLPPVKYVLSSQRRSVSPSHPLSRDKRASLAESNRAAQIKDAMHTQKTHGRDSVSVTLQGNRFQLSGRNGPLSNFPKGLLGIEWPSVMQELHCCLGEPAAFAEVDGQPVIMRAKDVRALADEGKPIKAFYETREGSVEPLQSDKKFLTTIGQPLLRVISAEDADVISVPR
jgi:hypothetical protein